MALPNGIASKAKDEWLALANSTDAQQRKQVTDVLRACGLSSPDYMPMSPEQRVDYLMKKQEEGAGTATTASAGAGGAKGAVPKTEGGGGGGLSAADRKMIEDSNALLRKVHDLLVVQIFSNPAVKANAEELDIKVDLLGNG